MKIDNPKPPYAGATKRRLIDHAKVSTALADQERRDAEAPPRNLLTTMGAVRLLGDVVLDRRNRGWTDPMLVELLRELGVEISAETLRVYRSRLKAEREDAPQATPLPPETSAPQPSPTRPSQAGSRLATGPPAAAQPGQAADAWSASDPTPGGTDDAKSTPFNRSVDFEDLV